MDFPFFSPPPCKSLPHMIKIVKGLSKMPFTQGANRMVLTNRQSFNLKDGSIRMPDGVGLPNFFLIGIS